LKILVLNCGSSSVKYQLIEMDQEEAIARGLVERIGLEAALFTHWSRSWEIRKEPVRAPDHPAAIALVLETVCHRERGVLRDPGEIAGVGHRVVHGGERFAQSVLITPDVLEAIRDCIEIAPLHNPPNVKGIEACQKLVPRVPQVVVFDTAFHQTMPRHAYLYGIGYSFYERYRIRRYGFHGTSHLYVAQRAAALLKKPLSRLRLITCHLGNGCSMAAVDRGRSVDTSMGFTPLEGLLMGTRSGDTDPAIVFYLMEKEGLTPGQASDLFNKQSGLKGLSGISSDMRELLKEQEARNERATVAVQMFAYRVKKYLGAYAAAMGGLDAVVFTGGIGENAPLIRQMACSGLEVLGIRIDQARNDQVAGKEAVVSVLGSRVRVLVIPTNEELMIARDTRRILEKMKT
jgi:acetate kinase